MFKLLRIPVLLVLMFGSGPLLRQYSEQRMRLNVEGMLASLGPWLALMVLAAAFAVVLLTSRQNDHPVLVLWLEGVLAAVIALVPPMLWYLTLGLGMVADVMGATTGSAFTQVLAVVWLVVVVRAGYRQRKRTRAAREVVAGE